MKLQELFFAKKQYKPREREIHTPVDKIPTEEIGKELKSLSADERLSLQDVFDLILRKYGPDGKAWAKRHLISVLSESEWVTPQKRSDIKKIKIALSKPRSCDSMKQLLRNVLFSPELDSLLDQEGDANRIVGDYIAQHHSDLHLLLSNKAKDCIDDCDGSLSPLGHEYENDHIESKNFKSQY